MNHLTLVRCKTAEYFPKTPYGFIANQLYKKKIKGKTAPATDVKKNIDWKELLREGKEYIAAGNEIPIAENPLAVAAIMMTGGTTGNPKGVQLCNELSTIFHINFAT